nr:SDR family oxidoreductase [Anaerolineae bacterium]
GVDFARELGAMGCHLILVARREDRLRQVADEICTQHSVQAQIITADLSKPEAPQQIYDQLKTEGKQVDVLINNAGYGLYGEFVKLDWEREKNMLELDILTVVALTKLFVRDMVARNFGFVLQVASIGAYQPSPLYATYSAAKSFVLNFSEAVNYELRGTNVKISVVSPGVTRTEFLQVSGQKPTFYQRMAMMESPAVVKIGIKAMLVGLGIKAMLVGHPSVVPGLMNASTIFLNRFMPRRMAAAITHRLMRSQSH